MRLHRYNLHKKIDKDATYADSCAICLWCHEEIDEDYLVEVGKLTNEDGQKAIIECPHCHKKIEITAMVALWRYAVRTP